MANTKTGPREYKTLAINNTVIIDPTKYPSKPDGWVMEAADFSELSYFLGYKFDPRSMYTIFSTKNIGRGGHMESRSKMVTVISGMVYYCLVDMRPGEEQGKVCEFRELCPEVAMSEAVRETDARHYNVCKEQSTSHGKGRDDRKQCHSPPSCRWGSRRREMFRCIGGE